MTLSVEGAIAEPPTLPEELILMLLNEESGFFHQVPGWTLSCTIAGAALAELSLLSRIDSDLESLILLDETATDDPALDVILKEIASESEQHNVQYWVERLAAHAESIIDTTLERLVDNGILRHHAGEFWTLAPNSGQLDQYMTSRDGTVADFVRTRD